jgi:protein-tyrosine phosphatase
MWGTDTTKACDQVEATVTADRILLVCTANICRSPMAGALLRDKLAAAAVDVGVDTGGFGFDDENVHPASVAALAARGIDLSAHRSSRIDRERVAAADLVLAMERAHVRKVSTIEPAAWARTFTLKEFVRRAQATGARRAGEPLPGWVARVHAGRSVDDLLGASELDDIDDPFGRSAKVFERSVQELDTLLDEFVAFYAPGA